MRTRGGWGAPPVCPAGPGAALGGLCVANAPERAGALRPLGGRYGPRAGGSAGAQPPSPGRREVWGGAGAHPASVVEAVGGPSGAAVGAGRAGKGLPPARRAAGCRGPCPAPAGGKASRSAGGPGASNSCLGLGCAGGGGAARRGCPGDGGRGAASAGNPARQPAGRAGGGTAAPLGGFSCAFAGGGFAFRCGFSAGGRGLGLPVAAAELRGGSRQTAPGQRAQRARPGPAAPVSLRGSGERAGLRFGVILFNRFSD